MKCGPRTSKEVLQPTEGPLHQRRDPRKDEHVAHTDLRGAGKHIIY